MKRFILAITLLVLLAGCATEPTTTTSPQKTEQAQESASIQDVNAEILNFAFSPESMRLKQGTTVTWTNKDAAAHTVTGQNFDSGMLNKDGSWSRTFEEKGTFEYYCAFHPGMKGTVIVE